MLTWSEFSLTNLNNSQIKQKATTPMTNGILEGQTKDITREDGKLADKRAKRSKNRIIKLRFT